MHVLFVLSCLLCLFTPSHTRRLPTLNELNRRLLGASKNGDLLELKESIKSGGDIETISLDIGKSSPIHYASNFGHLEIVKYLVGRGAGIEVKDTTGHTPLMYASFEGHEEIVKYLLSVGASVDASCMTSVCLK